MAPRGLSINQAIILAIILAIIQPFLQVDVILHGESGNQFTYRLCMGNPG